MSDTQSVTLYDVTAQLGNAYQQDTISIRLTSGSGVTDAVALAVAEALGALTLPPGVTCSAYATKTVQTTTFAHGDLASAPPTFL